MKRKIKPVFICLLLIFTMLFGMQTFAKGKKKSPRLNKTSVSMNAGKKITLKVKNYKGKVVWTSSNSRVASVTNGKVKAIKAGTAKITAKAGKKKLTCKIKVKTPVVRRISAPKKLTLIAGESYRINAKAVPTGAGGRLKWSSSNKKVASISSNGLVTVKKKGTTKITIKCGKKKATCKITVKAFPKISRVSMTSIPTSGIKQGGKTQLKLNVSSDVARGFVWRSSNPSVASVDNKGNVTARSAGTTVITASRNTGTGRKPISISATIVVKSSNPTATPSKPSTPANPTKPSPPSKPEKTGHGKLVSIKAWSSVKEAAKIGDVTDSSVTVMGVYEDGTSEEVGTYSISGKTSQDGKTYVFTVTAENGTLTTTFTVAKKQGQTETERPEPAGKEPIKIETVCTLTDIASFDELNPNTLKVYYVYADGSKKLVGGYTLGMKTSQNGKAYTITVSTNDKKFSTSFDLKNRNYALTPVSYSVSLDPSQIYVGEGLKAGQLKVTANMADGSKKDVTLQATNDFVPQNQTGTYTFHVTVSGTKLNVKAEIIAKQNPAEILKSMKVSLSPGSVGVGESLAAGQLKVIATMQDGSTKDVSSAATNDFTPKQKAGQYSIQVTYQNITKAITITVIDRTAQLTDLYTKYIGDTLYTDETITKSDIVVTGTYADGSQKNITDYDLTLKMGTSDNSQSSYTVSYQGYTLTSQPIPTYDRNKIIGLSVGNVPAVYRVGQTVAHDFDVKATTRDGREMSVSDYTVSPEVITADTKQITVSYGGKSISLDITVTG